MTTDFRLALQVRFPRFAAWWQSRKDRHYEGRELDDVFSEIHAKKDWGSEQSTSGVGSEVEGTGAIRKTLPSLLADLSAGSMLDIPCGDFYWMSQLDLGVNYIGADIVPALIERNRAAFPDRSFRVLDLTTDSLPTFDLVLCRDCLVHLNFEQCRQALENIGTSGAKYLLATTYVRLSRNYDTTPGSWRALNLEKQPFNLPKPLQVIDEESHEPYDRALGKALGLWLL